MLITLIPKIQHSTMGANETQTQIIWICLDKIAQWQGGRNQRKFWKKPKKKKRIRGIKRGAIRIEDDDAIRVCRSQIRVLRWEEGTRGRMFLLFALSVCFGKKKKKTHEHIAASLSFSFSFFFIFIFLCEHFISLK